MPIVSKLAPAYDEEQGARMAPAARPRRKCRRNRAASGSCPNVFVELLVFLRVDLGFVARPKLLAASVLQPFSVLVRPGTSNEVGIPFDDLFWRL